jgi:GntR family histidine utilization transcriptional repressor
MQFSETGEKTTYRDVKTEILRRITEGVWAPGALLPGEVELAESFGVARATANRALRELSDEGFIDRRRKAGTRVRQSPIRAARFEIPVVRDEIEATGASYRYSLLERETLRAPENIRARLGLMKGAKILHLICLHSADGAPYQLEDRWINLAALPIAESTDFSSLGPNEWLVQAVPYSEVEISFLATAAERATAGYLGLTVGEPVFTVERTTWWEGQSITQVQLLFARGHRMTTRY